MPDIDDFHRDNSFLTVYMTKIRYMQTNDEFLQKHLFLKCIHRLGDKMIVDIPCDDNSRFSQEKESILLFANAII